MAWSWWARLISVAARSSSAQRVAAWLCSAVVLLAREMTSRRREGGKAPRPTRPWSILKPGQPLPEIAISPDPGGMAIASELGGDLEVGGMILGGGSEDQAAAEDQGLGCGTGPHQGFEPSPLGIRQVDALGERSGHNRDPWCCGRVAISWMMDKESHKSPALSRATKAGE